MTKREFKWFTISQYKEEEAYLRNMHRHGWKLTHVGFPGFYTFEECVPEDVVYQLDYNREGTEHSQEYRQMFTDCGWKYLFDFVGFSYFCKHAADMIGEEEIFSDAESRLEMIRRVMKGRLLPLLIIFACIVIPQFFMNLSKADESSYAAIFVIIYAVLMIAYLSIFATFGLAYLKLSREAGK